jgi:hypothetical protein
LTGPVVKLLDTQCFTWQQNSDLDLTGISRVIGIKQMAEVQRPRRTGSCSLERAIAFSLLRPSPVEPPVLPEDVRSELAA